MQVSIRVVLSSQGEQVLKSLSQADLTNTVRAIGKIDVSQKAHIKRRFRSQGGTGREAWPPLSKGTIAAKIRRFGSNRGTLRVTDRLKKSLTESSHPENITRIKNDVFETGTSVPYARFHFKGNLGRRVVSEKQANFLRFGLGFRNKRIGSPIPLPRRDPNTPEPKQLQRYLRILEKELVENFESANIEVT